MTTFDLNIAIQNLTRSSKHALTAAHDTNFDHATREQIIRGAIDSNNMNSTLAPHVAEYTRRLQHELDVLTGE